MRRLLLFLCASVFVYSCTSDKVDVPDVSAIDADFQVYRFDKALASIDTNAIAKSTDELRAQYGDFFDLYFSQIVPLYNSSPEVFEVSMRGLMTAPSIRHLLDTTAVIYTDEVWKEIEQEFGEAFKYYKYYFPERDVPDVYTIISEYSLQRFIAEVDSSDIIGVGLDMYLGEDYDYMQYVPRNPAFSKYLTRRFNRDHIVKKSIEVLVDDIVGEASGDRMLDYMIHNGKRLYILDHLLPYTSDTVVMEYTADQLDWAEDNELEMWAFFFKEDLFYKTNRMEINKYIDVAPHSPGMPPSAPGRTANYIGWQIVKRYMQRHPETTLQDLVAITDAQMILDKSRYKPLK